MNIWTVWIKVNHELYLHQVVTRDTYIVGRIEGVAYTEKSRYTGPSLLFNPLSGNVSSIVVGKIVKSKKVLRWPLVKIFVFL